MRKGVLFPPEALMLASLSPEERLALLDRWTAEHGEVEIVYGVAVLNWLYANLRSRRVMATLRYLAETASEFYDENELMPVYCLYVAEGFEHLEDHRAEYPDFDPSGLLHFEREGCAQVLLLARAGEDVVALSDNPNVLRLLRHLLGN